MPTMDIQEPDATLASSAPSPTSYSPGTPRRLLLLAIAVALALGSGFLFVRHEKSGAQASLGSLTEQEAAAEPRVDAVRVGPPSEAASLVLPGQTAAWFESTIYARVNGYVENWFVDIGDHVTNGQTLATIDTPELDAELNAAKARLKASEAQVVVKQAQLEFAKTTYERWRNSPRGVVSEQEREDKKAQNAEAVAQLVAAQAQVGLDQAEVDRLSALEGFKRVKAPFDGIIIQRSIDIGNLVTAGSTANTSPLYRISKDDLMRVFVDVPQKAAAQLMPIGTRAVIISDYHPDQHFEAKVTRTAEAIDPKSRTLRVEIDIPNPNRALVPGIYVQVNFKLNTDGLIQVPAAALVFRSKSPQVAVVGENGVIAIKDVTIARDDGNVVEISSGLSKGDKVVLNLSSAIAAGQKVKANEIDIGPGPANDRTSASH